MSYKNSQVHLAFHMSKEHHSYYDRFLDFWCRGLLIDEVVSF